MKKYIIIFVSVIVIIWGTISIKKQYLLKDAFVFSDKDIVLTILLMDKPEPYNFDYKISKDLADNISKALVNAKKQSIKGDEFSDNYSKRVEILLDGEEKITKDDASITYKRRITLIKEENNDIYVSIDINDIKNDNMTRLLTRNYLVESKELSSYIDALYN